MCVIPILDLAKRYKYSLSLWTGWVSPSDFFGGEVLPFHEK
jgi:hypothetical protein